MNKFTHHSADIEITPGVISVKNKIILIGNR